MAVVYKRGLFFKPKNKKGLILSMALLLISLFALFTVHNLNNRTVSVNEHADTKLSPTIAEYSSQTACEGQTFVIKYKIVLKTPPMDDNSRTVTFALQAFFPGVTQDKWITYISGGGELLGHSAIKWSGKMHANEIKEFYYTLTIPGGKLKPGANYKNIAVLASSSGYKEQKDNSVVIDSCGAIVTNPILPTTTPTPTPSITKMISNVENSTTSSNYSDNESGLEGAGLLGQMLTEDNGTVNNTTPQSTNTESASATNSYESQGSNNSNEQTDISDQTSSSTSSNDYSNVASPSDGAQVEATNINTGVFDSPITAIVLLVFGVLGRIMSGVINKNRSNVIQYKTIE